MNSNNYDSDQSDEDFCPEKEKTINDSDISEEDDTASEISDDEDAEDDDRAAEAMKKRKCRTKSSQKKQVKKSNKSKKAHDSDDDVQAVETNNTIRRSTRQTKEQECDKLEKNELESDEDEKSRSDALWADFLSDVKPAAKKKHVEEVPTTKNIDNKNSDKTIVNNKKAETSPSPTTTLSSSSSSSSSLSLIPAATNGNASSKQTTITEVLDFAGEEIHVQKSINGESIKENKEASTSARKTITPSSAFSGICGGSNGASRLSHATGLKRPGASGVGGLGSILNQIGKKKKISVLEKTKLDWNSYKQTEGIEEDLQTFNKGKDGYLERQDFLQRTDLRQFEIEKNLRQSRRQSNH